MFGGESFHGAFGANGHEDGGLYIAMGEGDGEGPGIAMLVLEEGGEGFGLEFNFFPDSFEGLEFWLHGDCCF